MTNILISTIGARDYDAAEYEFDDGEIIETKQFTYALAKHIRPSHLFALLTDDAEVLQWEANGLRDLLKSVPGIEVIEVKIPNGQDEGELWGIFDQIADAIPVGAHITLDMTHGFRFSPMVSLLAVNYLRSAKRVHLKDVYYGAFDAVERHVSPKPVFRFGPFITLLDWANAVETFRKSGDCAALARLLQEAQTLRYRLGTGANRDNLPTHLKSVARQLERLSLALDLIRPDEVMSAASQLDVELRQAEAEFPAWAKPFNLLLEQINDEFRPLALANPRSAENLEANLASQWSLINWYLKHHRYASALLLAREWTISWYMRHCGKSIEMIYDHHGERDGAEKELHDLWDTRHFGSERLEKVIKAWINLGDQRNDLAHTGMRMQALDAESLRRNIVEQIRALGQITGYTK